MSKPLCVSKTAFFNLHINVLNRREFFEALQEHLSRGHRVSVNFLNAHCFNVAQRNIEYRNALERSTFLLNDGVGIDLAGKRFGIKFKENMNGTDLIPELIRFLSKEKMTVFFFGAKENVIKRAVNRVRANYPGIVIVGYSDGYVENPAIVVDQINLSRAQAVILGLGVPRQELWVDLYGNRLKFVKVIVCGGAIFDFVSGNVVRAPYFVRRLKLEWMFRLAQEPRRLFSRYVIGSFLFFYYIALKRG